jgi:hypothetical protein
MRIATKFSLCLAGLFLAVILMPSSLWAHETLPCPTEPAQDVPIASGETYWGPNCALHTKGDVDSFQFKASAGQTWSVVTGLAPSPATDICLSLYAPGSTAKTPLSSLSAHVGFSPSHLGGGCYSG